jgi:hypothetical protein
MNMTTGAEIAHTKNQRNTNMSDASIDKRFPKLTLSKIDAIIIHHETLATLEKEININTMTIPSNRFSGMQGHLTLTMTPTRYLASAGQCHLCWPNQSRSDHQSCCHHDLGTNHRN